jgi:hypothetical protein
MNKETVEVGHLEPKNVSILNNHLYEEAIRILTDGNNLPMSHIGFVGIGVFIDWLETNYEITPRGNSNE